VWMLSITWSRLGLGFSSKFSYVTIAWNSLPSPLPITFE
jgi:hypothetical protein